MQFKNIHEMEAMHLCLKSSTCREKNWNFHVEKCWETNQMQLLFVFSVFTTVESTHLILICLICNRMKATFGGMEVLTFVISVQ